MAGDLFHILSQATFVAKCVLALLCLMSLFSWAFMCGKWRVLRRAKRQVESGVTTLLAAESLQAALPELSRPERPLLRRMTDLGVNEYARLARLESGDRLLLDNVRRVLRHGVAEEMRRLSSALSLLATAANTAPFIGLFGTVWGIMHSFHAIGHMKSAALATVAPGISEALIATAVGLAVAIPATVGYNVFLGMLGSIEGQCVSFAGILLNQVQHDAARARTAAPGGE